jgi:Na+/H+ antiporter NhaA
VNTFLLWELSGGDAATVVAVVISFSTPAPRSAATTAATKMRKWLRPNRVCIVVELFVTNFNTLFFMSKVGSSGKFQVSVQSHSISDTHKFAKPPVVNSSND